MHSARVASFANPTLVAVRFRLAPCRVDARRRSVGPVGLESAAGNLQFSPAWAFCSRPYGLVCSDLGRFGRPGGYASCQRRLTRERGGRGQHPVVGERERRVDRSPVCRRGGRDAARLPARLTNAPDDGRGRDRQRLFVRTADGRAVLRRADDERILASLIVAPLVCCIVLGLLSAQKFKLPLRFVHRAFVASLSPGRVAAGLAYKSFEAETNESSAYGSAAPADDARIRLQSGNQDRRSGRRATGVQGGGAAKETSASQPANAATSSRDPGAEDALHRNRSDQHRLIRAANPRT